MILIGMMNSVKHNVFFFHTELPTLSSKPKLYHIDLIEDNGKKVRVIKQSASSWEEVATRLEFESHDISRLQSDYHSQCLKACRTVFTEWLNGKGRKPVTWETVIKALEEADLSEVAEDLKNIISTSTS